MKCVPSLAGIVDESLIKGVGWLRARERECIADIILYLSEIDRRRVYREAGYSSLFVFCREELGYSEASSYRRVQAARALRMHPELYSKLKSGRIGLCGVAEVMRVAKSANSSELLKQAEGKSKRDIEKLTAPFRKEPGTGKERVRVVRVQSNATSTTEVQAEEVQSKAQPTLFSEPELSEPEESNAHNDSAPAFAISITVDQEFMDLLARVKSLTPGFNPEMKQVLERALREYEERHCPRKKQARRISHRRRAGSGKPGPETPSRKSSEPSPPMRRQPEKPQPHIGSLSAPQTIPAATRDEVRLRDGAQCTFVSPDGRRCSCRTNLEIDHITPRGKGGGNELENLRLLCREHNLLMAERVYGKQHMERFRGSISFQQAPQHGASQ